MHIKDWKKEVFTIPNLLSLFRLALIPVYIYIYLGATETYQYITAGTIMAVSCLTDLIDGKVARRFNMVSTLGKILDPLADKVLVMAAMCYLVEIGQMPGWCLAIVLLREFAVSGMRLVAVEQGRVIAAAWSGKVKTASTMVAICLMLLWNIAWLNTVCWAVIVVTTVYSGVEYFVKNHDVFRKAA